MAGRPGCPQNEQQVNARSQVSPLVNHSLHMKKPETMHTGPPNELSENENNPSSQNSRPASRSTSREKRNAAWHCRTSREDTKKKTSACVWRMQRFNKKLLNLKRKSGPSLEPFTNHESVLLMSMIPSPSRRGREQGLLQSLSPFPPPCPVLTLPRLPRPLPWSHTQAQGSKPVPCRITLHS